MGFSRLKNHAFKLNKDCEQSKNLFPEKGSEVSRPKKLVREFFRLNLKSREKNQTMASRVR